MIVPNVCEYKTVAFRLNDLDNINSVDETLNKLTLEGWGILKQSFFNVPTGGTAGFVTTYAVYTMSRVKPELIK